MDTGTLSLIMPEGEANACPDTNASEDILRGRTLDNVLEITDRVVQLNFTPDIEVFYMLLERYNSILSMTSLKQPL